MKKKLKDKLRAAAAQIVKSFTYVFTSTLSLGNIADVNGTRGLTTLVASAALAGAVAALQTLEALLSPTK